VVVREGRKVHRERAGKNRRQAERVLTKIQARVDEDDFRPQLTIRFAEWGERWLRSLERKETTVASYRSTVAYATELFGEKVVRRLRPEDVAGLNLALRGRGVSASTRAKHLRVLGACLSAAVAHGYAGSNPVRQLPKAERPRAERKESAYFENEELPRLFAEVPAGLFTTLFQFALKTGMRQGELLALTWADVDLAEAIVRVRRTITDGHLSLPRTTSAGTSTSPPTSSPSSEPGGASSDDPKTRRSSFPATHAPATSSPPPFSNGSSTPP